MDTVIDSSAIDQMNKEALSLLTTDKEKSYKIALKAEAYSHDIQYDRGIVLGQIVQGWYFGNSSQYGKALHLFSSAEMLGKKLSTRNDSVPLLMAYAGIAGIHFYLGEFKISLQYNTKALKIAQEIGNVERQLTPLIQNAQIYCELERYDEALHFGKTAEHLLKDFPGYMQNDVLYQILGDIYTRLGYNRKALHYLELALKFITTHNFELGQSECLCAMGQVLSNEGHFDLAESKFLEATQCAGSNSEEPLALYHLSFFYYQQNKISKALEYGEKTIEASKRQDSKRFTRKIYKLLADIYHNQKDYEKAFLLLKKFHQFDKIVSCEESERRFNSLMLKYQMEEAQQENEFNKLKNDELENANKRLKIINDINRKINETINLKEVLYIIYTSLKSIIPMDGFVVAFYERRQKKLHYKLVIEHGKIMNGGKIAINSRESICAWVTRNNKEIFMNDCSLEDYQYVTRQKTFASTGIPQALISIPLRLDDEVVGAFTVQSYEKARYSSFHLDMLKTLSHNITQSIKNSRHHQKVKNLHKVITKEKKELLHAHEKIRHLAHHDSLTGVANRRFFMALTEKRLKEGKRNKLYGMVLFIDLDNFKPINDTYGHDMGDEVLKTVAQRLTYNVRTSDVIARLGGDEFVVLILPLENMNHGLSIVERMIEKIKEPILIDHKELSVGASVGVSCFPTDGLDMETLLGHADSAMYSGKKKTKGTAVLYQNFDKKIDTVPQ